MDQFTILQLVALLMCMALVLPGFIRAMRRSPKGSALKYVAIWLAVAAVVAILYRTFNT